MARGAAGVAAHEGDLRRAQAIEQRVALVVGGAAEAAVARVVHVDEVQRERHAGEQLTQALDLVGAVVLAAEQHPRDRDSPAAGGLVRAHGLRELFDREARGDRQE